MTRALTVLAPLALALLAALPAALPAPDAPPHSLELYDHRGDAPVGAGFERADFYEDVNVASAFPNVTQAMLETLKAAFALG